MKKKVLLSSIATIALCLCLIAGSTFALFTSNSDFNISVTAGDVEILATAGISGVYSAEGTDGDAEDKYLIDENNYNYSHAPQTLETDAEGKVIKGIFSNGGDAVIDGANLVINRITPGDRVDVDINVQNLSNVAISYRYKIEANDTLLAKGMVVTIDGKSYESLANWTSEWFTLKAPDGVAEQIADTDAKTISVELPVYAGNEYEKQTVEYTILVEAVQGNAVTENEASVVVYPTVNGLNDALANGGEVILDEDFNNVLNIGADANATLNLNGSALTNNVTVSTGADVTISGGDIAVDNSASGGNSCGFENNGGNATLTDVVMNAGDADDYSNISNGGSVEYNNVDLTTNGGGIGATSGAEVAFNSGSVHMTATTTNPRYIFYVVGEGTEVTISNGDFSFAENTLTLKRAYIYAGAGTTVYVTGGNFGAASNRSGYTEGILGDGTVIITGGTFGFNPSAWVADGYVAVESNGVWTVSAQ